MKYFYDIFDWRIEEMIEILQEKLDKMKAELLNPPVWKNETFYEIWDCEVKNFPDNKPSYWERSREPLFISERGERYNDKESAEKALEEYAEKVNKLLKKKKAVYKKTIGGETCWVDTRRHIHCNGTVDNYCYYIQERHLEGWDREEVFCVKQEDVDAMEEIIRKIEGGLKAMKIADHIIDNWSYDSLAEEYNEEFNQESNMERTVQGMGRGV